MTLSSTIMTQADDITILYPAPFTLIQSDISTGLPAPMLFDRPLIFY